MAGLAAGDDERDEGDNGGEGSEERVIRRHCPVRRCPCLYNETAGRCGGAGRVVVIVVVDDTIHTLLSIDNASPAHSFRTSFEACISQRE